MKREKGFTLIELMVVIVIIGILSAVALPRFMTQQKKAKEGTAWADLDSMTTALEMYYLDCDTYPTEDAKGGSSAGLDKLISGTATGWAGPYMKYRKETANIPQDPWGNAYGYEGTVSAFTVWCHGGEYTATVFYSAFYVNPGEFKSP